MDSTFRWDQDDETEEQTQVAQDEVLDQNEEELVLDPQVAEELTEEDQEAEDNEVLSNARLRLEQGKLYEMLLKHDFFEDVDSDERAVRNVQREIKNFVKERLEVLLGIRQDPRLSPKSGPGQFTELEVSLLKDVLGKFSGGATARSKPPVSAPARPQPSNQIKKLTPPKLAAPKPVSRVAEPKSRVTTNQAQNKVKPKLPQPKVKAESEPLYKSPLEMTSAEIAERNKEIAARQAANKAKSDSALPMPDASQQEMMYIQRQMNSKITQTLGPVINHMLRK